MKNKSKWLTFISSLGLLPLMTLASDLKPIALKSSPIRSNVLKVASWNLEWLATDSGTIQNNVINNSIKQSKRSDRDFNLLNKKFRQFTPDILAFQEVDSKAAIAKVVGPSYRIYLSDRSLPQNKYHQFDDINQYTGLAISDNWQVTNPADIELLANSKLRWASYAILQQADKPNVHLLSVHLKQGCPAARKRTRSCRQLEQQAKVLNKWIQQRVTMQQVFVIMGDFNHNLSFNGDWLWKVLTQDVGIKAKLVTKNTDVSCQVKSNRNSNHLYRYRQLIDHIIMSNYQSNHNQQQAQQVLFTRDEALNYHLSDHCPIVAELIP